MELRISDSTMLTTSDKVEEDEEDNTADEVKEDDDDDDIERGAGRSISSPMAGILLYFPPLFDETCIQRRNKVCDRLNRGSVNFVIKELAPGPLSLIRSLILSL